jgi:hypothetical protein
MKFSTLIFVLLVTAQPVRAQWLTMDQFNVCENILRNEYDLSPDSMIRREGALTKAEMLGRNRYIVNGFENVFQLGMTLLRYPRPANFKHIEAHEESGKQSDFVVIREAKIELDVELSGIFVDTLFKVPAGSGTKGQRFNKTGCCKAEKIWFGISRYWNSDTL